MSISYPLDLPGATTGKTSVPGFTSQEWTMKKVGAITRSQFTGSIQVQEYQGEWLECTCTLPPMSREIAAQWEGFFGAERAPVGTFKLSDSLSVVHGSLGIATGTPLVDGANQLGKVVNLKGFTAGVTGILKAGDFMSFGVAKENLYMVVKDCDSDGDGKVAVDIFPRILENTTDEDEVSLPGAGIFRMLTANKFKFDVDQLCKGVTFTAVQDV